MASVPPVIVLEGLIGAGKSFFLEYLRKHMPNAFFIEEPVDDFMHFESYNPLNELKYNAFATQYHIMQCLKNLYDGLWSKKQSDGISVIITERSLDSPVIFTEALHRNGNLSDFEKELLDKLSSKMNSEVDFPIVTGIFYLTTPPEICIQRIKYRNRDGEDEMVNLNYLHNLQAAFESYLSNTEKPLWLATSDTDDIHNLHQELLDFIKHVQ